jgi:hypothetical protein
MRGQISDAQATVYWVHPSGELMLAPDTRMRPFRGWRRVECKTVAETEQFSRRMAAQEYKKQRSLTVEQHMRSQAYRDRIKANCKLRLASGCISAYDEAMTRRTLENIERGEEAFYKMLVAEPDLSRASLVIERQEDVIGNAKYARKRRGLADDEVNPVSKLAEATA